MELLSRTWVGFTGWIAAVLLWWWLLQGQVIWWQPAALWALFAALWLVTRQLGADPSGLPFTAVLVFCGWIILNRIDPVFAEGHLLGTALGSLLFLAGLLLPLVRWPLRRTWAYGALILLAVTALFGESAGGAKAWLSVSCVRFQPVELAKVFFAVYLGKELSREGSLREPFLYMICFGLLLAWQRDLGPAVLVFVVFCWLLLYNSFAWYKLLGCLAALAIAFVGAVCWFPHVESRVLAWLRPWDYLDSRGYQVVQGLFALRSGGLVGQGLGKGLVRAIPHAHTDYGFAVLGEEFGFLGVCALLLCYLSLAFWAVRILDGLEGEQRLVGLGLTLLLHGQTVLVTGGVLRLMPVAGMTLPFVSYGSSSLTAQFLMLGIVAGLSRGGGRSQCAEPS